MGSKRHVAIAALALCLLASSGCHAGRQLLQMDAVPISLDNATAAEPSVQLSAQLLYESGEGSNITNSTVFAPSDDAILGLAALLGVNNPMDLVNATFVNATEEITRQLVIPDEVLDVNVLPEEFNLTFPTNTTAGTVINLIRNGTVLEMTLDNHNDTVSVTPTNLTWNGNVVYAISAIPLTTAQVELVRAMLHGDGGGVESAQPALESGPPLVAPVVLPAKPAPGATGPAVMLPAPGKAGAASLVTPPAGKAGAPGLMTPAPGKAGAAGPGAPGGARRRFS